MDIKKFEITTTQINYKLRYNLVIWLWEYFMWNPMFEFESQYSPFSCVYLVCVDRYVLAKLHFW